MKSKEIIVLILIIFAGVSFYYLYTGKLQVDFNKRKGLILTTRDKFIIEETYLLEAPLPELLRVENSHGNVEIIGWDENEIKIHFQKEIRAKKEKKASEISEKIRIITDKNPERIFISTNRGELESQRFKTHFKIYVPFISTAEIENAHGLVKVVDIHKARIQNRYGKVIASNINSFLSVKNSYEDIEVDSTKGNVEIESKYSVVLLKNTEGDIKISHKNGKIEVENSSEKVEIDSYYTEIYGEGLKGQLKCKNSYGKIRLYHTGPLEIIAHHSEIEIEEAKGDIKINNSYGKAKLTDIEGNLSVSGKSLAVNGRNISGNEIFISSSYRDIHLTELEGKTTVSISNGELILEPLSLRYPLQAKGEYADITFFWPPGEKGPFEARTKNGEIKWKLSEEVTYWQEDKTTFLRAFFTEEKTPLISLSTTYGDILIENY